MLNVRNRDIELPNRRNTYLDEHEIEFMRENWNAMSRQDMLEEINTGRIRKISYQRLYAEAYKNGIHKSDNLAYYECRMGHPIANDKLTCAERRMIRKMHREGIDHKRILALVNMKKDLKLSPSELTEFIIGLTKVNGVGGGKKRAHIFSYDDDQTIIEMHGTSSIRKITENLNEGRMVRMSENAVRRRALKLGCHD